MRLTVNATGMNSVPFPVGVSDTEDTRSLELVIYFPGGPFGGTQLDKLLEQHSGVPGFEWLKRSGHLWSINAGRLRDDHKTLETLPWFEGRLCSGYETQYGSLRGPMGNMSSSGHGLSVLGNHRLTALVFKLDADVAADSNNVFYSWMSDRENFSNRGFIEDCLEKALKKVGKDDDIVIATSLDRDTKGEAGSPDMASTIFGKIGRSRAFVADVTLIHSPPTGWRGRVCRALGYGVGRLCPNPNVLVELGYAAGWLGWDRCLLIVNTAFGDVEQLPFDLRGRRLLPYRVAKKEDRAAARESFIPFLQSRLVEALQL